MTGGSGFVGAATVRALRTLGLTCVAASRQPDITLAPIAHLDVTDHRSWEAFERDLRGQRVTGIVHLAASYDVVENTRGACEVVDAARRWAVPRVVVASTIGVYGGVPSPFREDSPLPLETPHGVPAAKKALELLAAHAPTEVVVARLAAVWGPGGNPDSRFFALPRLVHAAARGLASTAREGDAIDLIHVDDCGRALALLQTAPTLAHRVYNVGSGRPTANREVADAVRTARPAADILLESGAATPPAWMDVQRLGDEGFEPRRELVEGVADYVRQAAAQV
ncbi:MAG TPA: NAD(P)-dependent oxidoreductase [Nocardioides sp.]|nr:NAD(P)-dependent oxidoreductase [Nocardioides sp.]